MIDKACAIVISYNPSEKLVFNILALIQQFEKIIIIDNASCTKSKEYLEKLHKEYKIKVIYNKENLGIATALNIGVKCAINTGYLWIATFDQDSLVPPGFLDLIGNAYESCNYKENVALISPRYIDQNSNTIYPSIKDINSDQLFFDITTTLTSGNLVKAQVFENIGLFEESLFIDYVDHEFCLRCLNNGYRIIMSSQALLKHNLGSMKMQSFLGKKLFTTNHSHVRLYYKSRNRIFVYKRYFCAKHHFAEIFKWILTDIVNWIKEIVKLILFEKDSLLKLYFIMKGIYDIGMGRMGKYESISTKNLDYNER